MTSTRALRLLVLKEARALLPVWLATAATVAVGLVQGAGGLVFPPSPFLFLLGLCAFVLGTATLGAFSVGHEYTYRTLSALLTQPQSRSRILLSKAAALMPMLVALALLARSMLVRADASDESRAWTAAITGLGRSSVSVLPHGSP